ncbi:MAG: VWA domain-containing protein [Planctomycetaceae bacterium]
MIEFFRSLSLPTIEFAYPELGLLFIPAWFAFRRWGDVPGPTGWIRLAIASLLILCLMGPEANLGGKGLDVIVVADRSRSMPAESEGNIRELIHNLEQNRAARGHRVGIVTFGSRAQVERVVSNSGELAEYTREVLPDGSDLHDAVMTGLNLVNKNRPARILVLSDGESNGAPPLSAARRAREAGVPIDYRAFERQRVGDAAVDSILLPDTVSPREPFQFSVWVYADQDMPGSMRVLRDGKQIASTQRDLLTGMNRILFRDVLDGGGLFNYTVELSVQGDPLPENNHGAGVVRVDAGPKLLVLNSDGAAGNLVRGIRAGGIPVDVAVAADHPLTADSLDPYRAVILENVPADKLGRIRMAQLAQFVEDLGGGLMLTGGERSFGTGGYFKSPLDDVLPVSMEMREEHRKNRLALAIALDRSGSMTAPVTGGKVKMDLANLGTAECVRMLSPGDQVAVIAVDSAPHVVQPITSVEDPEAIANKALGIQSAGGGIFVYEALVAAGEQLMNAGDIATRHIILFADAADSEEPGAYKELLRKFEESGITVSVIGLGSKSDTDAALLEEIAKLGRGNIMFTSDAQELPRLFTQDTMNVARSTFIKKDETQPAGITGQLMAESRLMGELGTGAFPSVDGYNLSYLKPDATAAVISTDDYKAPWSAFWHRGLGRVSALTIEVDGKYSGNFGKWEYYEDFLITHVRWLLGSANPREVFVQVEQDGQEAVATIELDPDRTGRARSEPPSFVVIPPGAERAPALTPDIVWTGPDSLQARFRLDRLGTWRTLVKTSEKQFSRGPAVTLPYSPEFVPRLGLPTGSETLAQMADLSGGRSRADVLEIFDDPPRSARTVSLLPWLFGIAIGLLLTEIAGRRLSLWERFRESLADETAIPEPAASPAHGWKKWIEPLRIKRKRRAAQPARTATPAPEPILNPRPAAPRDRKVAAAGANVFDQAKERARKRTR